MVEIISYPDNVIKKIKNAIEKARKANVPIIYLKSKLDIRIMPHTDHFNAIRKKLKSENLTEEKLAWNWQVLDGIRPEKDDIIVHKGNWCNGFRDTDMRDVINALAIKTLIITGAVEPACVYGTFMGAFDDGIEPFVLVDCTIPAGSDEKTQKIIHDFSVNTFYPLMGGIVTTSKFLKFTK